MESTNDHGMTASQAKVAQVPFDTFLGI